MTELRMSEKDICDFCSDPDPVWSFNARDIEMHAGRPKLGIAPLRSTGAWCACAGCAVLIGEHKWQELEDRSVASLRVKYRTMMTEDFLREQVKIAHTRFRQAFEGQATA